MRDLNYLIDNDHLIICPLEPTDSFVRYCNERGIETFSSLLGLSAFKKHDFQPGGLTHLEVEVRTSITHTITVQKVHQWLERSVRTPKEALLKERLRALL